VIEGVGFSQTQMMAQLHQQMRQKFQAADTDGTKGLSKDELSSLSEKFKTEGKSETTFLEKLQKGFDRLDADGNGQLTAAEVDAGGKKAGMPPPSGPPPGMFADEKQSSTSTQDEENYWNKLLNSIYFTKSFDEYETVSYSV